MGKIISKKGIFFTFVAITIMTVIALVFAPPLDTALLKDAQPLHTRITSIDNYINDLQEAYFETVLRATTHKAILSLIFYMNTTGFYLKDLDSTFRDVMMNGTIKHPPGSLTHVRIDDITGKKIMENNTLLNWTSKITNVALDTLNINASINITNISVIQTKPWNIDSSIRINFTVKSDAARWEKAAVITTTISVEGFHDPYYLVNTNGKYTNIIKKSTVAFDSWNISLVREHLRNGTYVHWQASDAPSFLMRFNNSMDNSSCCGIESLVNPNLITPSDQRESYLDYMFWSHVYNDVQNCTKLYNITTPSTGTGLWDEFNYFKMDINHVTKYNITSKDAVRNC